MKYHLHVSYLLLLPLLLPTLILLLRRYKFPLLSLLLFLRSLPLLLLPVLLLLPLLGLLPQKVLPRFDLQIDFTLLPRWRKRRIHLLALIRDLGRLLPLAQRASLEMRQEAIPILGREGGVGAQLALDHEFFDVVDGVDVGHAIRHYAADFFQTRIRPHDRDSVALDEDVGLGQELQGFEGGAIGTEDTLAALDEAFFVANEVADLDYVTRGGIFEDFDGLWSGHGAGEEFDQVAGFEDGGWVVGFSGCADGHGAFDEVEGA